MGNCGMLITLSVVWFPLFMIRREMSVLSALFSSNEREIRRFFRTVEEINSLEPQIQALSDTQLRAKTDEFKERLAKGEELDDLLVETFAVVREASKRTLGLRHFDVDDRRNGLARGSHRGDEDR